jgi:predicted dehydrogenase
MTENSSSRRDFLKTSAAATSVGATLAALPRASQAQNNANERIRVGMIGPGGRGFGAHVKSLCTLNKEGRNVEIAAVAEVWDNQRQKVADYIRTENGNDPAQYVDYREMLEKEDLDAVAIATPDHWHAKQIIDSFEAGKHVYCEKPMTRTVEEALDVVKAQQKSGKVMQVGVQGTSEPVIDVIREKLNEGLIGKVLMFQTEYFRNSAQGQWRYYALQKDMTPKTIDWDLWLGHKEGLAEEVPFDREIYAQWRRFWPYGSGMYTDLFVHRVTWMLKATGLRYPARVVGAGGLYLEYDGRGVPDVATVAIDYNEGVHGLVSSTMCNEGTRLQQVIRGHFGSVVVQGNGFDFIPERPQVTRDSSLKQQHFDGPKMEKSHDLTHFGNWLDAIEARDPEMCNCPVDLGAAAVAAVILGARSYREGKAFHFDPKTGPSNADSSWADRWEQISANRGKPKHIPGWNAGDHGSVLEEPEYMALAGPWVDGQPPRSQAGG